MHFISDIHLFHKNILRFCPHSRKGADHIEMSEMIVDNIIATVPQGGDLWNLGDVSFGGFNETKRLLRRIADHCNHHLILGNHDKESELQSMDVFASIQNYKELRIGKRHIVLCHYPMSAWNRSHHGSYMLHGHLHSTYQLPGTGRIMDVGLDSRASGDMKPYSWDEIENILKFETIGEHHGD